MSVDNFACYACNKLTPSTNIEWLKILGTEFQVCPDCHSNCNSEDRKRLREEARQDRATEAIRESHDIYLKTNKVIALHREVNQDKATEEIKVISLNRQDKENEER